MEEIWNTIEKYPDYQVSNKGRVKSLLYGKNRILKPGTDRYGYYQVVLFKDNKAHNTPVHKLVAIAFLNHTPCGHKTVVNHIDFNKTNNNVENLELISQRENTGKKHLKHSSKYTGVCWSNVAKKWQASININRKHVYLGYFVNEEDAAEAYNKKLKSIKDD